jgi:hypothetical protein
LTAECTFIEDLQLCSETKKVDIIVEENSPIVPGSDPVDETTSSPSTEPLVESETIASPVIKTAPETQTNDAYENVIPTSPQTTDITNIDQPSVDSSASVQSSITSDPDVNTTEITNTSSEEVLPLTLPCPEG